MTDEEKRWIDSATYEQLLRRWRFAPAGDPMFTGDTGQYYIAVMNARPTAPVIKSRYRQLLLTAQGQISALLSCEEYAEEEVQAIHETFDQIANTLAQARAAISKAGGEE